MTFSDLTKTVRAPMIAFGLMGVLAAAPSATAQAQGVGDELPEIEIDRDADTLRDELRPRPNDVDIADTVLTFTNTMAKHRYVRCLGFDRSGTPVGRSVTRVPGHGVKFILASDLSGGRDWIGHVVCNTTGLVLPSSVFLGPQIENFNTTIDQFEKRTRLRFPLVATY